MISIIALLAGLSAGAFQAARRRYLLESAAAEVAGVLRAARNTAVTTATPTRVDIDPAAGTVTARGEETLAEWSFDDLGAEPARPDDALPFAGSECAVRGATVTDGCVGRALGFRASGAYADCGQPPALDAARGIIVEVLVRHDLVREVAPPRSRERRPRLVRSREAASQTEADRAFAIVERRGAFFLGLTADAAIEAWIGEWGARTAPAAVPGGRWVRVSLRYDGDSVIVAAGGLELPLSPVGGGLRAGSAALPGRLPSSTASWTISSSDRSFPGDIDEVRVRGELEPVVARVPEAYRIAGTRTAVHFDRRGHLDPKSESDEVRIAIVEDTAEDAAPARGRTSLAPPDEPASARRAVIEVDRLGVVR